MFNWRLFNCIHGMEKNIFRWFQLTLRSIYISLICFSQKNSNSSKHLSYDLHKNFYQHLLHLDQLKEFFHNLVTLTDHMGQH
ncbi:hypothetical protein BpHYR1_017395 [Brachionus plicatilis]|uniref:Uncharacterized protein n=1 Tax=Brachionus plicatilis TaxID=10195 RepID=A0A3M7PQ98_BRAPC|nr:hypothetical protein BpHYR1_017395 [Brachionus plicatilis]